MIITPCQTGEMYPSCSKVWIVLGWDPLVQNVWKVREEKEQLCEEENNYKIFSVVD